MNEIYVPKLMKLIDLTNNAYTKKELKEMEEKVIKTIDYGFSFSTCDIFYDIISKSFNFDNKQKYLGECLIDLSLIDYNMLKYKPSIIALASSYIVMKYFRMKEYKYLCSVKIFDINSSDIKKCAKDLCNLTSNIFSSNYKAIKKKYSLEQFGNVSELLEKEMKVFPL